VATGSEIDLPAAKIVTDPNLEGDSIDLSPGSEHTWPRATARDGAPVNLAIIPPAPMQRLFYAVELKESWCALRNPQRQLGVGMAWDKEIFPHLWVWEELGGDQRMPFYGRGELVALEPATQFPPHGLAAAHAAGEAHVLQGGRTLDAKLTCVLFAADERPVRHISIEGDVQFAA